MYSLIESLGGTDQFPKEVLITYADQQHLLQLCLLALCLPPLQDFSLSRRNR
ncbi:hypothetical protein E2C01_036570 [Portunus trituberculatus]|uniref:Uncharacterized protein n=1 Tax=Portunus trituberculatus TaxID=210409 RepID=A0A5B7FCA8_PORTR|nr:hypothetical protein [Portunus trituberculatus]